MEAEQAAQIIINSFNPSAPPPEQKDYTVYFQYIRLGDILKVAMDNAGWRGDINLILGNYLTPKGETSTILYGLFPAHRSH